MIDKAPKSKASIRSLPFDTRVWALLTYVKGKQLRERAEVEKKFGKISDPGYVFTKEVDSGEGKVDMVTFLLITNLDYDNKKEQKNSTNYILRS